MRRLVFAAAVVFAAFIFSGCGASNGQPSAATGPTPTPVPIQSRVAAYADADVMEADGQLIIGIRTDSDDPDTACTEFFNEAEAIYADCVSGQSYTGVSFSLVCSGKTVGSVFILQDEGGIKVYSPMVFNVDYETAFYTAFYASDFAKGLAD